ncbi:MAG: 50S ribosomal protein L18 [Kiritimatiellia bacterium]|jgi:large subunit ribosomal protein L18
MKLKTRSEYLKRRHQRLRKKVIGTTRRPRMCVSVSNKHMYVQLVDDVAAVTLATVSTLTLEPAGKNNLDAAKRLGAKIAEIAKTKEIGEVVFDRGGHAYNGRVKAIAEAARAAGMKL